MDPPGSVEIPSDGEENIAPRRPPYIPPLRPRFKPPRRSKQFTISTPSLPLGVQLVGTMTGKIDWLKYADHDTSGRGKFPQFAPGTYLHFVKYDETRETLLEVKRWAAGLDQAGLLKMLDVPHFGRGTQVTVVVKQLLSLVHEGHLWIGDKKIPINGELIQRITGLPIAGPNPVTKFPSKHEDTKLA